MFHPYSASAFCPLHIHRCSVSTLQKNKPMDLIISHATHMFSAHFLFLVLCSSYNTSSSLVTTCIVVSRHVRTTLAYFYRRGQQKYYATSHVSFLTMSILFLETLSLGEVCEDATSEIYSFFSSIIIRIRMVLLIRSRKKNP